MNINGIDKMAAGSKDYEQIVKAMGNREASKIDDDDFLFKTMQYYEFTNVSDTWSSDAQELDIEDLIEKWKEFDEDNKSFAKDFDEFDAYMKTYTASEPEPEPEPNGGETDKDGIIEFNGVRYEVYKKFNAEATDTIKWSKAEDGRTVFEANGWNITVIGAMNDTNDKNYANVVIKGNSNSYFGSNDEDSIEIQGNKNSIHGDTSDENGTKDNIKITSGTGNYVYGEEGDDVLDTIDGNFFNLAIKDVETVNGQSSFPSSGTGSTEGAGATTPSTEITDVCEGGNCMIDDETTTISRDNPAYALTDDEGDHYHQYTLRLIGQVDEEDNATVSREDLAELGLETEEDLANPANFEKIREASDLTEMLDRMIDEDETSESEEVTLAEKLNVITPRNVLDMYESCATGDNKDKPWAARMMELCVATGMITVNNGIARVAEDAPESQSAKDVFSTALHVVGFLAPENAEDTEDVPEAEETEEVQDAQETEAEAQELAEEIEDAIDEAQRKPEEE